MPSSKRCNCSVCRITRRMSTLAKKGTKAERDAVEELLLDWEHQGTEAAYWEMKYRGTWPT